MTAAEWRGTNLNGFRHFRTENGSSSSPQFEPSPRVVGGGVRIHPENARMSGRHGVQYAAQCVACAALTPVVWQYITNLSPRVGGWPGGKGYKGYLAVN